MLAAFALFLLVVSIGNPEVKMRHVQRVLIALLLAFPAALSGWFCGLILKLVRGLLQT
jgi:hypothetical protein